MIRSKTLILIATISTFLLSCGNVESQNKTGYLVKGTLTGIDLPQLYLIDLSNPNAEPVDTAIVGEDGSFEFNYVPQKISFYRINLNQNMALIMPLKAADNITINGDATEPSKINVKGSKDAERMLEFNLYISKTQVDQAALNEEFQQFTNHPNQDSILLVFQARYQGLLDEVDQHIRKMIDEDASLFSNLALMEQLRPDVSENIPYFKKVETALAPKYGDSKFFLNFKRKVDEVSQFMPGSEVPEINLSSPDGKKVALSSLRGKVVLIDFWASWCKPCRHENPNVVAAYQKYKNKGFTVYGVSLDRTKEAWVNAIEEDNLTWTHVSDLKFWQSEAAQAYGVSGIPFAILIDKDGKVIGKNLRGQALFNKLAEVLD